jgi:hypothetical protein
MSRATRREAGGRASGSRATCCTNCRRLLRHRLFCLWTPAENSHTYIAHTDANTHVHMHLRMRVRVHLCTYKASDSRSIMKVFMCVHIQIPINIPAHIHIHTD